MATSQCVHINAHELQPPRSNQAVYREDCTQCFDSIDSPHGLDVCLYCFNGGCKEERAHSSLHYNTKRHPLALNIRRTKKTVVRDEPPLKVSKVAIVAEAESDRYETKTSVTCYECQLDNVDVSQGDGRLASVVDGVLKASTFAKQEEVKAWELEMTSCTHIDNLKQEPTRRIEFQSLGHCSMCDLQENLWLCLECGNLGCGRAQFGGVGGQSHGLAHSQAASHGVAVKLGSITPEGTADVYCYKCDEERVDANLGKHLAHWGIMLADRQKTEMSLGEMQFEQNMKWDFSMTTEDGKELEPFFGPGLTGLKNLGNSCYLASTLQCLFALPQFKNRYLLPNDQLPSVSDPAQDLETQMRKLADGLLSGRYSQPSKTIVLTEDVPKSQRQEGLAPAMLKHLVGRGHEEFSTMRQQDAFEFLLHLFKLITRSSHTGNHTDPTEAFRFVMEQRLQCKGCKKVRYSTDIQDNLSIPVPLRKRLTSPESNVDGADVANEYEPVTLKDCLDSFTAEEAVELTCSDCGSKDGFTKRSLFKTFPEVLAVNARRFVLKNWVPTKVDVAVVVGDAPQSLDEYKSHGLQSDEQLLEDVHTSSASTAFVPNDLAKEQLEGMGFPVNRAIKALHATGNQDTNAAMEWLFAHMEDADIDEPLQLTGSGSGSAGAAVDPGQIEMIEAMGFTAAQGRKALKETGGDMERAVDWLFSHPDEQGEEQEGASPNTPSQTMPGSEASPVNFQLQSIICHKGSSIHAGHYVAFVRKQVQQAGSSVWVLFNDEKVVQAADFEEMSKFAYVYFFQRS